MMPPESNHASVVTEAFETPGWYLKGYAANIRVRHETVAGFASGYQPQNVLDIGCGDGSLSLPFLSQTCKVTYLDLSSAMLDIVKSRVPTNLLSQTNFVKGDVTQVDLPPTSFDTILFVGVLAYLSNPQETAHRLLQLIRPGGMLIVECTDAGHFFGRLNLAYRRLTAIFRPSKSLTYRHRSVDVIRAFESEGFALKKIFKYTYSLPIISRFLSQDQAYRAMRKIYGTESQSKKQGYGSELLMLYRAPTSTK